MLLDIYTDGGSRGNPGISGFGLVIYNHADNTVLYQEKKFLGIKTNNEAEYLALIAALTWIDQTKETNSYDSLNFYSDSQLMVRQVTGIYRVKAENIKPLHDLVQNLLNKINLPYTFKDIRREKNTLADSLANMAMDQR